MAFMCAAGARDIRLPSVLASLLDDCMMNFMEVAVISVLGAGLLGLFAVLVQHLLSQNAQRSEDHKEAMAAITEQGKEIAEQGKENERLHERAMAAVAAQGREAERLHERAMAAVAAQGREAERLHERAMAAVASAIASSDRGNLRHRERLHAETMRALGELRSAGAALVERTAALEAVTGLRTEAHIPPDQHTQPDTAGDAPRSAYVPV